MREMGMGDLEGEFVRFLYVPMHVRMWEDIALDGVPLRVTAHPDMGQGFLPVFLDEEELKRRYPESEGWTYGKFAQVKREKAGESSEEATGDASGGG